MTSYTTWLDCREQISQRYMRGYRTSCSFEGFTGADIILTPLKSIISQATIQTHLDAGAVMIQVKHSTDLSSSIIDQRLFEALLRMNTWDCYQYQCGLLVTGEFTKQGDSLHIDGRNSFINWSSYIGALNAWVVRGGSVYPNGPAADMQHTIDMLGQKLFVKDPFVQALTSKPRKKFEEEKKFRKGMTLRQKARLAQKGVDEHDLRHILVNIDGLSNRIVEKIWAKLTQKDMAGFVGFALSDDMLTIKGVGPKTLKKVRRQLGYD